MRSMWVIERKNSLVLENFQCAFMLDEIDILLFTYGHALRANNDETSTPRKFTLEGDR